MARNFVRASSQYLELAGAVATATPITLAAWFNTSSASTVQGILGLFASANVTNYFRLDLDGANHVRLGVNGTFPATTTTYSTNVWNHACAVCASSTSRAVYLNAAGKSTNLSNLTPSGIDLTDIGRIGGSAPANYFNGLIAEAAIWNKALTDDEVTSLTKGASPLHVRPGFLLAYWPLFGLGSPEPSYGPSGGTNSITVTSATAGTSWPPVAPQFGALGEWEGAFMAAAVAADAFPAYLRPTWVFEEVEEEIYY